MKAILFLTVVFLALNTTQVCSQQKNTQEIIETEFNKNAIYLEFFGNGLFYSINYERSFKQSLAVRFGGSYSPDLGSFGHHITFPVLINYQLVKIPYL